MAEPLRWPAPGKQLLASMQRGCSEHLNVAPDRIKIVQVVQLCGGSKRLVKGGVVGSSHQVAQVLNGQWCQVVLTVNLTGEPDVKLISSSQLSVLQHRS